MLHLAQVKKNLISGDPELELLAYQKDGNIWELDKSECLPLDKNQVKLVNEGLLLLVECSEDSKIIKLESPKDLVLSWVEKYLSNSAITPEFIEREQARVEKWRQEMTVESQDLTCRRLEIETRREELQELEQNLKKEREELEREQERLQEWADNLEQMQAKSQTV